MKKGTKLAALLLGLALVIPACNVNNSSKAPDQSSADPASEVTPSSEPEGQSSDAGTSSEEQINYTVTISNKDALQAEWFVGDQSRKVELNIEPKANITQLVNEGVIQISSSNAEILSITGQMASPVAAGEATITVKCGESQDTVAVTLKAKQTVKEKYGVAHEGTEADPFTNEEACKVAKAENYNNEDFYVQGKVASFYHLPGSRTDGAVSFYLEPATAGGEKFEVYKCYKSTGSGEASYLTDDDIWVGGIALAHGTFTTYGDQAETTGAKLIKCEGNKPQPRQTLTKTFAETLAAGNALADGDATWDYYKFQGYVTLMEGDNYFLTASKAETLTPGKSDAAHSERDIKGTNAIELFEAGKNADLKALLLKNAKVEVTMIVKNYHGTIENGIALTKDDVTLLEAGEPWVINYQNKTVAEALTVINALEDGKTADGYFAVSGVVVAVTGAYNAQYGNMSFTMGDAATDTKLLTVFRLAVDAETAAKVVAGAEVTVKGQLQKYVKDGAMTPELINAKEIEIKDGQGGGGDPVENLTEAVALSYTGLTGKGSEIKTDALAKIGQGNAHVKAVTSTKIYDGNGSGGAFANTAGFLKTGGSSAAGQIVLTLDGNANKVEILCHDFYKKSADHPTNSNNVSVNGSDNQLAPYNEEATFATLTFDLATATDKITIDFKNRVFIKEIKLSYSDGAAQPEIAQPTGTFFASAEITDAGKTALGTTNGVVPIFITLGAENAVSLSINGNAVPATFKSFDKTNGNLVITTTAYGDLSMTYNPETGRLEKLSVVAATGVLKYDGGQSLRTGAELNYWNCDGETSDLQSKFNRRSGNSSWSLDSEEDRIVKNTEHAISGSAMQVNKKSDNKERISVALKDFSQPFNARNISLWVYNDGSSSVNLQAFYYKQVNYGGYQQIFSGKACPAGQWTYISVGFTAADVYAFQFVIAQGTASTLIFDDICLF